MIKQSMVTYETYVTCLKEYILGENILIVNSQLQAAFDRCFKSFAESRGKDQFQWPLLKKVASS